MGAEPTRLAAQRVQHLLRDISDKPFIAIVLPENGDVKVYVAGLSPAKMLLIQQSVEEIINSDD